MKSFSYIYNLITLFAVRNPALRNAALSSERHMSRVIMDLMTSSEEMYQTHLQHAKEAGFVRPEASVSYEQMRDFVKPDECTVSIPTQRHIHRVYDLSRNVGQGGTEILVRHDREARGTRSDDLR